MYLKKSLPYNKNSGHKHVMNVQIIKFTIFQFKIFTSCFLCCEYVNTTDPELNPFAFRRARSINVK